MEVRRVRAALAGARVAVLPEAAVAGPRDVDDDIRDQSRGLTAAASVTDRALQSGLATGGAADEVPGTLHVGGGVNIGARARQVAGHGEGRIWNDPAAVLRGGRGAFRSEEHTSE